jgi:predicted phage baseplate assembly protein
VALPEITLDDRRFDQIVAEARRRIPGYTPEWTDLNESDPGITLVQLFAWLSEMIIWRLNRIPDKVFIKFLDLIGVQLAAANPAQVELTFTLSAPRLGRAVLIPRGTRVSLAEAADGRPVIFETDDNLFAVSAQIGGIQSYDGTQYDLVTEASRVARQFFFPFGERPQKGAALFLGLTEAFPPGRHTLTIHAHTADLQGGSADGDPNDLTPPVQARWEYWAGDRWQPLAVVSDTTVALTRSGLVLFDAPVPPAAMEIARDGLGLLKRPEDPRLFWLRFRIEQVLGSGFELVPRLDDVLLNTIGATNAATVTDELLGASNGTPGQQFRLGNAPVLAESLQLDVLEKADADFVPWRAVRDLSHSKRDDRHYVLDTATGTVTFGDDSHGAIPPVLVEERPNVASGGRGAPIANIRARVYRWGGGAAGNAGAGKITSLESTIPFVSAVTNLRPAEGGEDAETLEQAKARVPLDIRSRSRAVTAEDFEHLARQTPGARIRRAKALPLHHPDLEPRRPAGSAGPVTRVHVPGVVTVLVVPESRDPKPVLREETRLRVERHLEQHRLVSTEIHVAPARFRRVEIEARVVAKPDADSGRVQRELIDRLLTYFHPLTGGDLKEGWEFGRSIFFSETYRQILTLDGVLRLSADALVTYVDDVAQPRCEDIPLAADELVWSSVHRIEVRYS